MLKKVWMHFTRNIVLLNKNVKLKVRNSLTNNNTMLNKFNSYECIQFYMKSSVLLKVR